jgi:hypothetical protein
VIPGGPPLRLRHPAPVSGWFSFFSKKRFFKLSSINLLYNGIAGGRGGFPDFGRTGNGSPACTGQKQHGGVKK